jgi:ankyrin repeat protein
MGHTEIVKALLEAKANVNAKVLSSSPNMQMAFG